MCAEEFQQETVNCQPKASTNGAHKLTGLNKANHKTTAIREHRMRGYLSS